MTRESRVHEAAARWFLRLNGKRCTAEDREAFRAWRSEPANAAAYAAVEAAWAWSGNAAEPAEVDSLPEQARTRAPARALPLAAAAACIVAAALVAGWLLGCGQDPRDYPAVGSPDPQSGPVCILLQAGVPGLHSCQPPPDKVDGGQSHN